MIACFIQRPVPTFPPSTTFERSSPVFRQKPRWTTLLSLLLFLLPVISHRIIVIREPHVLQTPPASATPPTTPPIRSPGTHTLAELLIPLGSFVLGVPGQHALDAHADALDTLDRRPAGRTQKIETDDAVAVDVWMDGDRTPTGALRWGRMCRREIDRAGRGIRWWR